MSKKALLTVIGALLVVGGIVAFRFGNKPISQPDGASTGSVQTLAAVVWYEIPELGIKFPADQQTKDELTYFKVPNLNIVYLSDKTLESITKDCSAQWAPLGAISRVTGTPSSDPDTPACVGGEKVKDFDGGYLCYTKTQATCMSDEEWDRNKSRIENTPAMQFAPGNPQFWSSVQVSPIADNH